MQLSSWVIGGLPAGINFREGLANTNFADSNPFLLHTVKGKSMDSLTYSMTAP